MRKALVAAALVLAMGFVAQAAIDPTGLIGYWQMDDPAGSTSAADSHDNGYDGTVLGCRERS